MHKSHKLRRFHTPATDIDIGDEIVLSTSESQHIISSLRMQRNAPLIIFNGKYQYLAEIVAPIASGVRVRILEKIKGQLLALSNTSLLMGMIRTSNFELAVQKAVELGISSIAPLHSQFSQIKVADFGPNRLQRIEKIIIEAAKQSERDTLPDLLSPISLNQFHYVQEQFSRKIMLVVPREENSGYPITAITELRLAREDKIAVFVGPEGGFSTQELDLCVSSGFEFYHLGQKVLKSETSAIYALSILDFILMSGT